MNSMLGHKVAVVADTRRRARCDRGRERRANVGSWFGWSDPRTRQSLCPPNLRSMKSVPSCCSRRTVTVVANWLTRSSMTAEEFLVRAIWASARMHRAMLIGSRRSLGGRWCQSRC